METHDLAYWQNQEAYWRSEMVKNERLMRLMWIIPLLGVGATYVASRSNVFAMVTTALTSLLTFFISIYMTMVRRYEFRDYVEAARIEAAAFEVNPSDKKSQREA